MVIDKETEDQKKFITYVFLMVLRKSCYGRKLTPESYRKFYCWLMIPNCSVALQRYLLVRRRTLTLD
jgi:hypothetical protein